MTGRTLFERFSSRRFRMSLPLPFVVTYGKRPRPWSATGYNERTNVPCPWDNLSRVEQEFWDGLAGDLTCDLLAEEAQGSEFYG